MWVFCGGDTTLGIAGGHFFDTQLTGTKPSIADLLFDGVTRPWPGPFYIGPLTRFNTEAQWYATQNSLSQPVLTKADFVTKMLADDTPAAFDTPGSYSVLKNVDGKLVMYYIPGYEHQVSQIQAALRTSVSLPHTLMGLYAKHILTNVG
jgi:hypothetical protein